MTMNEPREAEAPALPDDPKLAAVRRYTMASLLCSIIFFGSLGSAVALFCALKALFSSGDIPKKWRALSLLATLGAFAGLAMMVRLLLDVP